MNRMFTITDVEMYVKRRIIETQGTFIVKDRREAVAISRLVEQAICECKRMGMLLSNEDVEKIKFKYDLIFKEKVMERIRRDCDKIHAQNVKNCEKTIRTLQKNIENEIKRIEELRWESIGDKKLKYNLIEGKVMLNKTTFLFSSIKGATVNIGESQRIEVVEKGKSKKHASVGGALVGGMMFGAVGSLVGGTALGKNTYAGVSNSNVIPTANRVSVVINVDGFENEVILLDQLVDQDSRAFRNAIKNAQEIISKLQYLSSLPVPSEFLKVEEEPNVIELQQQLNIATNELEAVKANVPKYEIPSRFLIEEQVSNIEISKINPTNEKLNQYGNTCPNCGNQIDVSDTFCCKCGDDLRKSFAYCSNCGTKVDKSAAFCHICGNKTP